MTQTLKNTMIMVVESLINKFEEDQEIHREKQHSQSVSQYADNCSDSDSSFNQVRDIMYVSKIIRSIGGPVYIHLHCTIYSVYLSIVCVCLCIIDIYVLFSLSKLLF